MIPLAEGAQQLSPQPTIGHGQESRKPADGMWWLNKAVFGIVALGWALYFYTRAPDWESLGLGGFTGMMFAFRACEKHGPGPYNGLFKKQPPDGRG